MIFNQSHFKIDLRQAFCNAVKIIFGDTETFLDFLEDQKYSDKYECYLDDSGENYIINRETGEYINWYKLYHLGRCINISTSSTGMVIQRWIEIFLSEFKESEGR